MAVRRKPVCRGITLVSLLENDAAPYRSLYAQPLLDSEGDGIIALDFAMGAIGNHGCARQDSLSMLRVCLRGHLEDRNRIWNFSASGRVQ